MPAGEKWMSDEKLEMEARVNGLPQEKSIVRSDKQNRRALQNKSGFISLHPIENVKR